MTTPRFDLPEIHRAIALLLQPGLVYELRVLNTRWATVRSYYTDYERLARAAGYMSGRAPAVYLILNPVARNLRARAADRLVRYARETTSDSDILARRWLPIDLDAVRPAGISSTPDEHQAAIDRAIEAREWLGRCGWPGPTYADSGNGAHLLYRVDLPNDADATDLLRNCLRTLSFRFDDERVKVDTGNYNAARIWKLYGTLVCKGDSISEGPHRLARILEIPELLEIVPRPLLQSLAGQVPSPALAATSRSYRGPGEPFNVESWIAQHGIPIHHRKTWNGGNVWILARCIWIPEHADKAPYIVQFPNGAIAAGCHHNGCQGKGWDDLREAVEPGYRERKEPGPNERRHSGRRSASNRGKFYVRGGEVAL